MKIWLRNIGITLLLFFSGVTGGVAQTGALKFDGVDDYIEIPYQKPSETFTIEARVKWAGNGSRNPIVSWYGDTTVAQVDSCMTLYIDQYGYLTYKESNDGLELIASAETALPWNRWQHVGVVRSPEIGVKLYVEGKEVGFEPATVSDVYTNAYSIGRLKDGEGYEFFKGELDQVLIWNRFRSADEISETKYACASAKNRGLKSLFTFDGAGPTINRLYYGNGDPYAFPDKGTGSRGGLFVDDLVNGQNAFRGRLWNFSGEFWTNGPICGQNPAENYEFALEFNGFNDRVSFDKISSIDLGDEFTIEFWCKIDYASLPDGWNYSVVSKRKYGSGLQISFPKVFQKSSTDPSFVTDEVKDAFHFALSYKGKQWKMYINGNLYDYNASAPPVIGTGLTGKTNAEIVIGEGYVGGRLKWFKGLIDDFKVWEYARTQQEINESMFRPELSGTYGSLILCDFNGVDTTFVIDHSGKQNNGDPGGVHSLRGRAIPGFRYCSPVVENSENHSLVFNGERSVFSTLRKKDYQNEITISGWVNINQLPSETEMKKTWLMAELSDYKGTFPCMFGIYIDQKEQKIGAGSVQLVTGISNTVKIDRSIPLNEWIHFSATYDGRILSVYCNGDLVDSTNILGLLCAGGQANTIFGCDVQRRPSGSLMYEANSGFIARLDDVRVWSASLSGEEVIRSMNACFNLIDKTQVAVYDFDDKGLFAVRNKTSGVRDGYFTSQMGDYEIRSYSIEAYGDGITGSCVDDLPVITPSAALQLDGKDDYVQFTNSVDSEKPYTIEIWYNAKSDGTDAAHVIVSCREDSTDQLLITQSTNDIHFYHGKTNILTAQNVAYRDTAIHIAASFDGSKMKLYINGIDQGTQTVSSSRPSGELRLFLGKKADGRGTSHGHTANGMVDNLRVWDRVLEHEEIVSNAYTCYLGNETGLIALYDFDKNFGASVIVDQAGADGHGIVFNASMEQIWHLGSIGCERHESSVTTAVSKSTLVNQIGVPNTARIDGHLRADHLAIGWNEVLDGTTVTIDGLTQIIHPDSVPAEIDTAIIDDYLLWVQGGVVSDAVVVVQPYEWSDHVFFPTYDLIEPAKLEEFIRLNGHLPGIPSESEIRESGYREDLFKAGLLEKIEELTLYLIDHDDRLDEQKEKLELLEQYLKKQIEQEKIGKEMEDE